ncbi:MAG: DUF2393 family protein [Candidatus Sulfotelmatobacter sp.]
MTGSLWAANKRPAVLLVGSHQIDNQNSTIYNRLMDGLIEPTPVTEERDSSRRTIAIAVTVVIAIAVIFAFLLRGQPKTASGPPPYAASLKLSDFKMSAAENFVGATVSYVDGTVTNAGDKTVTHVVVEVQFKDDMGQLAQREDIPMQVLKTDGPYPEAVDFSVSPLGPGQSKPFRLTFEGISAQWNRQYPEIQVTDVAVK